MITVNSFLKFKKPLKFRLLEKLNFISVSYDFLKIFLSNKLSFCRFLKLNRCVFVHIFADIIWRLF